MVSPNPMPSPSVPDRAAVAKTFVEARVLAGFMDDPHFRTFSGEYLASLTVGQQQELLAKVDVSRKVVAQFQPAKLDEVEIEPLEDPYLVSIQTDPVFRSTFGNRPFKFAMIRPEKVVALQVHVKPRADPIPVDRDELLEFVFPKKWDVPAELTFFPPIGPIYIASSSPLMQGVTVDLDAGKGTVTLSPPKHLNLLQIVHFSGRYYLRNGYHRLFDVISSGRHEVPALVVEALQPQDVALAPGVAAFDLGYVMKLERPPLVADFSTGATITTKMRERRYGVSIGLQISPFGIGI